MRRCCGFFAAGRQSPSRSRRQARWWALVAAPSLALVAALAAAQPPTAEPGPPRYAGKPLTEVLFDLRDRGLKIIFTTNVVRPGMTIAGEPAANEPRALLDEILEPHGLEARDGPGQTVVIVPRRRGPAEPRQAGPGSAIDGTVRSRRDSAPVGGVTIRLAATELQVTSGANGDFLIPDLEPGTYTLEVRRRGFVVERLEGIAVAAGRPTRLAILLDPAPITEEVLVVTPSRLSLLREEPQNPLALSRDEIFALPHLGDDPFRALSLLPGVASNDVTAQFHVRGGRRNETRVLLDGQELYDTYHLKDFDSAMSVIAAATLESVDLSTGGFSVEHGDRMSGVLDMRTVTPTGPRRTRIGAGVLSAHLGSSGSFQEQRGSWLAHIRRGSIDFASQLLGKENPRFWDGFGKLDYQLDARNSLRVNTLFSGDELEFTEVIGPESKSIETHYRSSYLWLTHQSILGDDLFVDSAASRSRVNRDRRGLELEEDVQFEILDRRELEVLALRQDWNLQLTSQSSLKWGFALRSFDALYDYRGTRTFDIALAQIRDNSADSTFFGERFEERHDSVYAAGRVRFARPLTLELGLRYDHHSLTSERRISPRLNLAWAVGGRSALRLAWGRFNQSQRPYELQIEDGETQFNPVERSESRVLGFEHLFEGVGSSGLALRMELYHREVLNPLPRWENLYEPINIFPEVEPDRVRIAPERSFSEGLELFVRGGRRGRLGWWASYTYAQSEDRIGEQRSPRSFDQTHSLNLDFDYRISERWTLNLAWRFHTGWPTTPLTVEQRLDEDGEVTFVPVAGPRFSARLPDYHRLDLRASRSWSLEAGELVFYVDIQNVYDRGNIAGFDYEIDSETGALTTQAEEWAGALPSLGLSFEF